GEGGGGLVQQRDAWLASDGPHEPQPLALTGGKLRDGTVEQLWLESDGGDEAFELGGHREVLTRAGAPPSRLRGGLAHAPAPPWRGDLTPLSALPIDRAGDALAIGAAA